MLLDPYVINEELLVEPTSIYKSKPSCLIVLDDCVYNKSIFGNNELNHSITRHRHDGWSLALTSQTLRW